MENSKIYKSLFQFSKDGIIIVDKKSKLIVDINNSALKLLGYVKEELINQPIFIIYPEQVLPFIKDNIIELTKNGNVEFQTQQQKKNKLLIDVEVKCSIFMDGKREVFQGIITDISERKKIVKEMYSEKLKFEALFTETNIGMVVLSESFYFIHVNNSFCNFIGYSSEELKQLTDINLSISEDIAKIKGSLDRLVKDKNRKNKVEKEFVKKGGTKVWGEIMTKQVKLLSGEILYYATIVDITDKKEREQALVKIEERFKLAISQKNIGIWDWNVKENILIWDDSMYELYQLNKENFSEAVEAWQQTIYKDDMDFVIKEVQLALAGEKIFNTTFRIVTTAGAVKFIKANGNVQFNKNNEPVRMTGINIDITKEKKLEQQRDNDIINIEEAERQRISHDLHDGLGQRIAAANMYMNSLEGYVKGQLDEETLSIFETSKKLINECAKETRLVSHNISPQSLKQFGLADTIEEMLSNYQKINKKLLINFTSNLNKFRFNSTKELSIYRAIQELVNNAIKHSESAELICGLKKEGNTLSVTVIDKGIGFDIEKNSKNKNTGIGLVSLSQRINMIGGKLRVDSVLGKGTEIEITINLNEPNGYKI